MSPLSHGRSLYFAVSTPTGGALTSLSSSTREVNGLPGEQDLGDITVAGNVGYNSFPGLQKADFSTVHVLDGATTGTTAWGWMSRYQSIQQTAPSSSWGVSFGPAGTTVGFPLMTCNALIKSISLPAKVTDPNIFTVNWTMNAGTTGITIGVVT